MTKDEIKQVLDLSLEYYKSEVFGTDKESEKPSCERIDWIYDKINGSSEIPKDLEKAAGEYADKHGFRVPYDGSNNFYDDVDVKASKEGFINGAKWDREQIMKDAVELELKDNVNYPSDWNQVGMVGLYFYTSPTFKFGDKVRVIVLPKED